MPITEALHPQQQACFEALRNFTTLELINLARLLPFDMQAYAAIWPSVHPAAPSALVKSLDSWEAVENGVRKCPKCGAATQELPDFLGGIKCGECYRGFYVTNKPVPRIWLRELRAYCASAAGNAPGVLRERIRNSQEKILADLRSYRDLQRMVAEHPAITQLLLGGSQEV